MLIQYSCCRLSHDNHKVFEPYVVTLLNQTPKFEWYMARLVVKCRLQIDSCYDYVGLCAQHIYTILGAT